MSEIVGLFPTPLMRIEGMFDAEAVARIVARVAEAPTARNAHSDLLSHTDMIAPSSKGPWFPVAKAVAPKLAEFGALLFGEALSWSVKEMWVNVLETGGAQAIHDHANSFVSGIVYLTPSHPSANTVFVKSLGGTGFVFGNTHRGTATGPFNGGKWVMPRANAGDMVLFPSHLLHEVPVNRGGRRMTLSFNAIPERLDNWGYTIRFSK